MTQLFANLVGIQARKIEALRNPLRRESGRKNKVHMEPFLLEHVQLFSPTCVCAKLLSLYGEKFWDVYFH